MTPPECGGAAHSRRRSGPVLRPCPDYDKPVCHALTAGPAAGMRDRPFGKGAGCQSARVYERSVMFRRLFLVFVLLFVLAPVTFLALAMEDEPAVAERRLGTPEDAVRARAVLQEFRELTEAAGGRRLRVSEADMNAILGLAGRGLPLVRGEADVRPDMVRLAVSADATRLPGGGWLNLRVAVAPSERGVRLASVRVGPFGVPAGIVVPGLGFVLDTVLGDGLGQVAISSIDGVRIADQAVVLGVNLDEAGRGALARGARDTVRTAAGLSDPGEVRDHYLALEAAVGDRRLGSGGSVVPFLRFAMDRAHRRGPDDGAGGEIRAALFAVAIYCGHARFEELIGDVVPREMRGRATGCAGATLARRGDLRQHFVISAGLEAAADSAVASAIGEFKELIDTDRGGSGFSFDDLAADRAGIRFARAFLDATATERERLLALVTEERAILPSLHGLPTGLSHSAFRRRFGDVDAGSYKAMVAEIDQRIDRLVLHARP